MTVGTEGDLGDIIYTACVLSHIPRGPHTFVVQKSDITTLRTWEAVNRVHALLDPLISSQSYIKEFRPARPDDAIDWHSGNFRGAGLHYTGYSLIETYATHLQMVRGFGSSYNGSRPWLTVEPSRELEDMFVMNRTFRYQNPYFPWPEIVRKFRDRLVFIGLPHEHKAFCKDYGKVSYRQTYDYLEVARLIAGCRLFIGNQSSAHAIAAGLGVPIVQETSPTIPDCLFKRNNIQYVTHGGCEIEGHKFGQLTIDPDKICTSASPPGMWQRNGHKAHSLDQLIQFVYKEDQSIDPENLRREIIISNVMRTKGHFFPGRFGIEAKWRTAFQNANIPLKE